MTSGPNNVPTRIAVVGYGRFGKLHAQIVEDHPLAVLAAVVEPSEQAREQARASHRQVSVYPDMRGLLDEPVDAVLIVSPEDTHAAIAEESFRAGMHVFSEKPLALGLEEARRLVETSGRAGLIYQAGYVLRYETRHRMLWDLVNDGSRIGDVSIIRAKRDISRSWFESYGSRVHPVYETLVHDIDLAVWFSGAKAETISAWSRHYLGENTPETFIVVVEFTNDTIAVLETTWLVPDGAPVNIVDWAEGGGVIDAALEISGSKGTGTVKTYEPSLALSTAEGTLYPDTAFWPVVGGKVGGALRTELWDFLARARGDEHESVASIEDALHVQEIAEAALEAAERQQPVTI